MKRKKILVFGYFGYVTDQLDGQTVKTRSIYELVKERADADVVYADSQEFRKSPKSIFKFIYNIITCSTLIWLPAHNNLKYLFPLIWYISKIFKVEILYVVVGGWLSTMLKNLPFHRKKLASLKAIFVENRLTIDELKNTYNYTNVRIIPNFRPPTSTPVIRKPDGQLRLVFMARINIMKGIDTIADICRSLPNNVSIDFYGPINSPDKNFFYERLVYKFPFVKYRGVLSPEEIHPTLQNYDVMLLPTHYYTEGFPGSILDAYRAGIPVIVTNWKHASEFVDDGRSGFIVDFDNPTEEIIDKIILLSSNMDLLQSMKWQSLNESRKYTSDAGWLALSANL